MIYSNLSVEEFCKRYGIPFKDMRCFQCEAEAVPIEKPSLIKDYACLDLGQCKACGDISGGFTCVPRGEMIAFWFNLVHGLGEILGKPKQRRKLKLIKSRKPK